MAYDYPDSRFSNWNCPLPLDYEQCREYPCILAITVNFTYDKSNKSVGQGVNSNLRIQVTDRYCWQLPVILGHSRPNIFPDNSCYYY